MAQEYPVIDLCLVLRVPRSSYYAWRARQPSARAVQNELLRARLASLFVANRKVYGSPRLAICLQRQGIPCSRNRVARHLRALQLKARQKRALNPKPPTPTMTSRSPQITWPKDPRPRRPIRFG